MWKKLSYNLKTPKGEKTIDIYSHFKEEDGAEADRGKYTLKEDGRILGTLCVDLFVPDQSKWEGSGKDLTKGQVSEIAAHICAHDLGGGEPF